MLVRHRRWKTSIVRILVIIDVCCVSTVQAAGHTVNVHCLRSQADGGILDKDDIVCDVAADKEQVERELVLQT